MTTDQSADCVLPIIQQFTGSRLGGNYATILTEDADTHFLQQSGNVRIVGETSGIKSFATSIMLTARHLHRFPADYLN